MTLELFPYQAQAADIMAARERFGLHDEMGIGKTATTIGALDRVHAKRCMIICPAMLRENWLNEFKKFSKVERRICKGRTQHDMVAWLRGRFDTIVCSYEQATKWRSAIMEHGEILDAVAMDEAHYLKNIEANRTKAVLGIEASGQGGITSWAAQSWHVTGTPMANDPMDIYAFLRFAKCIDMPPDQFVATFFHASMGAYTTRHRLRPEMQDDIQQLIYNNSIRRTHGMVGMELPPIHLTECLVEGKDIDIAKALAEYPNVEMQIVAALETGDVAMLDATHIAIIRRLVGKAKALAYSEMLVNELKGTEQKRVVFAWHTEPLLHVKNYAIKKGVGAVAVYGATPEDERVEAVHRFMHDPDCQVFVGNIKVAGTGLTLTASNEIDMMESDWSPAGNAQAIKRVHRYGQTLGVRARFITLANSIDVRVNQIVAGKTASIAEIEGHAMTAAPLDNHPLPAVTS